MFGRRFVSCIGAFSLVAMMCLALGGCPFPPANQPPIANAGADQTVATGVVVALNGSASSDPDGDPLTYMWTQLGGTAVALSSATTAAPTFTAPAAAATLTFQLEVRDGRGGSHTNTVVVTVTAGPPPPPLPPVLFIANLGGNNITSYANPRTVNGNIAPDTNLAGLQTQLSNPTDIVVDAGGALLACNSVTNSITAYNNAVSANGNFAPDRHVIGAAVQLFGPSSLAVSTGSDLVFVANPLAFFPSITVYANASTAAFNGNLPPTRTIVTATSGDLIGPQGINLDGSDNLYVANTGAANVLVFAGASALNGDVTPTRIIGSPDFAGAILSDVYVDAGDRMYVVDQIGRVLVFNNASTLNGWVSANFILTVPGAAMLTAIAVDSGGTGYIVDQVGNAVYSYDGIATLNGMLAPDRTIQGALTQLSVPSRVYLYER